MTAWKLALVVWLPILVIGTIAGGIYLHVHHDNDAKAQQAQAANQAAASCKAQAYAKWGPYLDRGDSLIEQDYQSALGQC